MKRKTLSMFRFLLKLGKGSLCNPRSYSRELVVCLKIAELLEKLLHFLFVLIFKLCPVLNTVNSAPFNTRVLNKFQVLVYRARFGYLWCLTSSVLISPHVWSGARTEDANINRIFDKTKCSRLRPTQSPFDRETLSCFDRIRLKLLDNF